MSTRPVRKALVLAAGRGTRIQAKASDKPKPLIRVDGESVLERNLRQLAAANVQEVWINLHYLGEQIETAVGDGGRYGLNVRYLWEPELLGTAGTVKKLESQFADDTFLVVYGDNLTLLDLSEMVSNHRRSGAVGTIAVFDRGRVPNTGVAGGRVVFSETAQVLSFEEEVTSNSPYVNAGIYVFEPALLRMIPAAGFCDFGHDLFPDLIAQGVYINTYAITGYCLGIDTPEALARAESFLRNRSMESSPR